MTATPQTQVLWRPAPAGHPPPAPPTPETPIYATLLRHWRDEGRCLPGEWDDEWAQLASRPPWPADWGDRQKVPAPRRSTSDRP